MFSARMSLNDIATAPHQSTLLTASPQGEAKKIRQKKDRLPPRGKLLAKQGDEGGNLFSARMSLHDIVTAPHLSTLLTASPQGEAGNKEKI